MQETTLSLSAPKLSPFLPLVLLACFTACGDHASSNQDENLEAPREEPTLATAPLTLPNGADEAATEAITPEFLRSVVATLADDAMEGRGPGTAGDAMARKYLIEQLDKLGLKPGGADGSWEQSFRIVGVNAKAPKHWTFTRGEQTLHLAHWDEYIASSGVQEETSRIENAEVVFVGYGIEAPEYGWDDFKGADLKGKVLLMLNNDPDWDAELFEAERRLYYGRWTYKYESAARQGAAGAIIIHTTPSAGYNFGVVQHSWTGPQFELPAAGEPRIQVAGWTSWEASEQLATFAGQDLKALAEAARSKDFQPVPLGITTSFLLENEVQSEAITANVLGILPGNDPAVSHQVVIYTGHHDHLGRSEPSDDSDGGTSDDHIYNGARDNASGVAMVLAIAKAYTLLPEPPRRSILFAFVAAEEQGLLGSKFYAQNPTIPAGNLVANINFDSGNIWGRTTDLSYIGYGKSTLDAVAEAAAAKQGREVVGDQFPDQGLFYRSDQFSLAKIGVPAMYLSEGTNFIDIPDGEKKMDAWLEENYHQVSDELEDSWGFDGMVEDAQVGFWAGLYIAQGQEIPAWNPGDEFEAARKAALLEVGGN
jgi:Zn-dependent M28 family amino/carboxypeptidase